MNRIKIHGNRSVLLALAAAVLLVVFLLAQIVGSLMNTVSTVEVMRVTADDSFTAQGWFFRDETLASGVSSETVKHIVRSGEKVQKDAPLAIVYTDAAALETSQKVEMLSDEVDLLTAAIQTSSNSSDVAKLDQQIASQIAVVSSKTQGGVVNGIGNETTALRNLCLRRSAGDLDGTTLSAQLSALTTERDTLEKQLSGRSTTIASPASGFFSEIVDGFEGKLTLDALASFSLDDYNALKESEITDSQSGVLGKVVGNFRWYFVMEVTDSTLDGMEAGDALRLRFPQVDDDVPVTVKEIRKQENADRALLILSGLNITPELVTMRCQTAEVIRASYTGIKVPKTAVRLEIDENGNQQQGVYILPDSLSRFKKIEVLYEGKDYYIVKQGNSGKDTGLVAGDKVIVKARGLENLKVMK